MGYKDYSTRSVIVGLEANSCRVWSWRIMWCVEEGGVEEVVCCC